MAAQRSVPCGTQKNSTTAILHENQIIPEFTRFIQSLHFALIQSRKDATADFNTVVEKYINEYLRRCYSGSGKYREFVLYRYESRLDDKKGPYKYGHLLILLYYLVWWFTSLRCTTMSRFWSTK